MSIRLGPWETAAHLHTQPAARYITDGDIAALIPPDPERTDTHKADKLAWRVERHQLSPGSFTTSMGDEDYTFNNAGQSVKTTWKVYLGKHLVSHQRTLDGVRRYFQHADKRTEYDEYKIRKADKKARKKGERERGKYEASRTAGQEWADSWAENGDYYGSTAKGELEQLIADAPDDFDTTVLTEALSSIEEAIKKYHKAQR